MVEVSMVDVLLWRIRFDGLLRKAGRAMPIRLRGAFGSWSDAGQRPHDEPSRCRVRWPIGTAAVVAAVCGLLMGAAPAGAQQEDPAGAQQGEPECGTTADDGTTLRASLQVAVQPVEVSLGRKDDGLVEREIRMAWSDGCTVPRSALADNLVMLPGVLEGVDSSIPADAVKIVSVDAFQKIVRLVVAIDRSEVDPGRYEGSVVIEAEDGGTVIAHGQVAMIVKRQEALVGPHLYWNPLLLLLVALVGGLLFGWWRATTISSVAPKESRFIDRRTFRRNIVTYVLAVGAGIGAWTLNYLKVPDFRFDASAVMGLFAVVAGAVVTTEIATLRPIEKTDLRGATDTRSPMPDSDATTDTVAAVHSERQAGPPRSDTGPPPVEETERTEIASTEPTERPTELPAYDSGPPVADETAIR